MFDGWACFVRLPGAGRPLTNGGTTRSGETEEISGAAIAEAILNASQKIAKSVVEEEGVSKASGWCMLSIACRALLWGFKLVRIQGLVFSGEPLPHLQ